MKIISKLASLLLISQFACGTYSADRKNIQKKVASLNSQTYKLQCVSLNVLGYLVDADAENYLLLSHLEQSGEIEFMGELEKKDYVKTQKVNALRDETQSSDKFLHVTPIGDGIELQRSVVALEHNIDLQLTR